MRKFTLYHALLIVLIAGIGVVVWQTVLLNRTVANQTSTLEQALERTSAKQIEAVQKPPLNPRTREAQANAMPVYVVNSVSVSGQVHANIDEPLKVEIDR